MAASIGIGLLVGGAIKLVRAHRASGGNRAPSWRRVTALVFGALASAAVTSGALYLVAAPEIIACD